MIKEAKIKGGQMQGRKELQAHQIIRGCLGTKGVWASPYRYRDQCWTRDFVIAAEPWLLSGQRHDLQAIVASHLHQLAMRQGSNGQIPIMFLDNTGRWILTKIWHSIRNRRLSFLLKAYLSKGGVAALSPWTRDSEFLFVLGILQYVACTGDRKFLHDHRQKIEWATAYIEDNLMKDGLILGVDWRDTRRDLDGKALLTNNCLLYQTYLMLGEEPSTEALKNKINLHFWTGQYYRDHPETNDWDTLGNALVVLLGIASEDKWPLIFDQAEEFDTPRGYKVNGVTLPTKGATEAEVMKKTNQYGVIWPFIHHFMTLALIKGNRIERAKQQFTKFDNLDGFFEWYDPLTGQGWGSKDQLWSAALYLRVLQAFNVS